MRSRLTQLTELSAADLDAWRRLAEGAIEPNVFHEPEYVLPLAEELGLAADVALMVVEDDGDWHGCLPVHAGRWHRIPARAIGTWRAHPLYSLLGTPLIGADRPHDALALIAEEMRGTRRTSFAALEWTSSDGPVAAALAQLLAGTRPDPVRYEHFERAALHRREQDDYIEGLSPKHRREIRRQRRKLGERLGGEPEVVDRSADEAAADDFIALEAGTKKATEGTVLAAGRGHAEFFRRMCRELAAQDRLQMLSLQVAGRTVAAKCNLIAGDTIFCFKIAYDEEFASLSPGIQLEVEMIKFFHERSIAKTMDSCAYSGNPMINRLWPDRRAIATWLLPSKGPAGLVVPAMVKAREIRENRRGGDPA